MNIKQQLHGSVDHANKYILKEANCRHQVLTRKKNEWYKKEEDNQIH